MTIILTRKEAQKILEENMDANYSIGDQKLVMPYPSSEITDTVTFEVKEPEDAQQ